MKPTFIKQTKEKRNESTVEKIIVLGISSYTEF